MNHLTIQELIDVLLTIEDKSGIVVVGLDGETRDLYVDQIGKDIVVLMPYYED
jgi:hypothetical protein